MNRLQFLVILVLYLFKSIESNDVFESGNQKRVLISSINPNCNIAECSETLKDSDLSVLYVRSSKFKNSQQKTKQNLDLHFILSTYNGSAAFFIVSTLNNSDIRIVWKDLVENSPGSIKFVVGEKEIQPNNTIGIMISEIFMWLDNDDTGDYKPDKNTAKVINSSDLKWKNITILEQTDSNVHVEFELKEKVYNGTIKLRLKVGSTLEKYVDLPRLQMTARSIHTQLIFDGFQQAFPLNNTNRLGLQLTVISQGKKGQPNTSWTIDDEDSPGLFKQIKYGFGEINSDLSFLSFKPNVYTSPERLIAKTQDTTQSELTELKEIDIFKQNSAFYGFYNNTKANAYQMFITFGSKGQEYYSKTNHTEFSFVFGLNDLPDPEMGLFLKMVIIIGTGLSLLVLLIFPLTICLMTRKMKQRRESALLNNQDSIY